MIAPRKRPACDAESGFALLFIYALAATVAIMLYMELPRAAFEAQRDKEQLLIDRGEQYSRAIGLYVRKFNRYPPDFNALENTQNLRFLRHRYVDPMTGKEEWRLIHVGPGGVFTDSLLYTKKKDDKAAEAQTFITEMQQTGGNPVGQPQGVNLATRTRPSDQPGAPGDPNNPSLAQPDPNGQVAMPPQNAVSGPVQVLPDGRIVPVQQELNALSEAASRLQPGAPGAPGTPGGFPFQGGAQLPPGVPLPPGVQLPPGVTLPPGVSVQPGVQPGVQSGTIQAGQQPNAPPTAAVDMINRLLTTPRPGGLNGLTGQPQVDQNGNLLPPNAQGAQSNLQGLQQVQQQLQQAQQQQPQQQTIGGGIAGVASKVEQSGIKVYRDRSPYNEWEFVYDITKDTTRAGAATGIPQTPAQPAKAPAKP